MPSLCSVSQSSQSDPITTAKGKECGNDIIDLDTDGDMEIAVEDDCRTDNKDSPTSKPSPTKHSDGASSLIDDTVACPANTNESEDTKTTSTSASSTPNSKKRKVTPPDDPGSKQKQQKKVNQMTLSSFFFQGKKNKTTDATPSKTPPKRARTASKSPSPAPKADKNAAKKSLVTDLVEVPVNRNRDTDESQTTSTPSEETKLSPKKVAEEADGIMISVETKTSNECQEPLQKDLPSSSDTKPTAESSSTKTINILSASAVKKKRPSRSRKATSNGKENNAEKATQSTSTAKKASTPKKASTAKKTKQLDSLATTVAKKELSESELSEENRGLLQKYRAMKERYLERVNDVTNNHREGFPEEDFGTIQLEAITDGTELKTNETSQCEEFPPQVVTNMALLIEGSRLPLSQLVSNVCSELEGLHSVKWSTESVSAKVKLMSQRKAYFDPIKKCTEIIDLFEDNDQNRLWRWEVTTLDLLNSDVSSKARKARYARKKISSYQSSLLKLIKSLEDTEKQLLNPSLPNLDKAKAKISRDEEKVLKYERDAEKQRLAEEAKALKLRDLAAKKKAKEEAVEAKRREKEEAKKEVAEKKKREAEARENEKRKKEEERLQKEEAKKREEKKKQETFFKQKSSFRSFFAAPKKKASDEKKTSIIPCADTAIESFDVDSFRAKINSSADPLGFSLKDGKRSSSAKASRKRRSKMVKVRVYKTVKADPSEWGAPDYLEQSTIKVPNSYRFLSFHEDCRPAYRGTWTKKSSIVTGKNPFAKDSTIFDYEYDSEIEWEEGDDEMGEDVEDDADNQEEDMDGEGNTKLYDYEDGFCVADDRLLDNEEGADEDTKALYKKKMLNREEEEHMHANRIRIIAPAFGGVPLYLTQSNSISTDHVEGFETVDVTDVLMSYEGIQLSDPIFCLDPFPQLPRVVESPPEEKTNAKENKDDYSVEAMIVLAKFSHHSTHNSKEKLIEELKTLHPEHFSIRAKATRKLDAIAIKKKHPKYSAVYWEVKKEILTELGLTDIMEKKVEDIVYDSSVKEIKPPPSEDQKPKTPPKGKGKSASKGKSKSTKTNAKTKKVANTKKAKSPGTASKKKKTTAKTKSAQKPKPKKKATTTKCETPGSASKAKGRKDSPKIEEDVSAGMKNIMAQFVKKSPVKTKASSPKDAKKASSSQ